VAERLQLKLTVQNICFTYEGAEKPALDSVSFGVDSGEYVAVVGANGSGKSTLARCIAGLLIPSTGSSRVTVDSSSSVPVAQVFQSPSDQIIAETVELDVAFGPENLGLDRETMHARVSSVLESFSLSALADSPSNGLSSGQKQHLALAGVLALNPNLLVLDEPTSMLAQLERNSVMGFLDRFHASGGTILHVTHDLSEASRASRVLVLSDGKLVFDGKPADLPSRSMEDLESWALYGAIPSAHKAQVSSSADPVLLCSFQDKGPLAGVSLSVKRGTITAITGESGSGKTLLLEILAGLREYSNGSVVLTAGETVALAVQESEASLFSEFVADDVAFGPRNIGLSGKELIDRVKASMDIVGLPFELFADRKTFSLSGGERRKAALAGIIAMNSSIILLDEPSSALDTRSRSQLLQLIINLRNAGKTVIFTTNRQEECLIADIVVNLEPRKVIMGVQSSESETALRRSSVKNDSRFKDRKALDRLRHGAAGSWHRLDTPLHALPPVFKYILTICAVVAALAVQGWPWLCILVVINILPAAIARYPLKKLAFGVLKILPWFVFLGIFQYFLVRDLSIPFAFILRFIDLYIPLCVFVFITSHTEIMYGMEDILSFLKVFRIPVRDVSLVTGLVFRFIPLLYEEALRITTARVIRGASSAGKKGLGSKISSTASLFVPLMLRTLSRAVRLSEAITARYYGVAKNSRYLDWKITIGETILGIVVPVITGLFIFASAYYWH
jgi:energy-coupling factor transport system permease/ATP-binding protein